MCVTQGVLLTVVHAGRLYPLLPSEGCGCLGFGFAVWKGAMWRARCDMGGVVEFTVGRWADEVGTCYVCLLPLCWVRHSPCQCLWCHWVCLYCETRSLLRPWDQGPRLS
jgi:hypothetical protein